MSIFRFSKLTSTRQTKSWLKTLDLVAVFVMLNTVTDTLSTILTTMTTEASSAGAPAFFAKAEMGAVRFQQRKICWRLLPSAARVRPAPAAAIGSEEAAASVCP